MRRIKFFEKSYFTTLVLFLLLLNACIFSLALYTHNRSSDSAIEVCRSEQFCIIEAFERDYEVSSEEDDYLLMLSYGTFYSNDGIMLRFANDTEVLYSGIPEHYPIPEAGQYTVERIDDVKHIVISETVCDGAYTLTYAKDISYLDEELKSLSISFGLVSVFASLILALALYFMQRKLFVPLDKLREATKAISQGDFSARADESGNDEFAELAEDFNAMSDKINEQMDELKTVAEEKQTMLDNLGHEMRTPLTSIYGYAEYVFRNTLDEEKKLQVMLDIMSESKRLKRISDVLLDSAFIRENGIKATKLSAGELMVKIQSIFLMRASEKRIKLTFNGSDFEINGDETLLEILIANLTENAVRACRENGKIELGAEEIDGVKTLYVRDNGIGMTKEQIEHITEPFYRTDKARSRTEGGTGLGLALCKRIAEAHNATLEFESEPNVGTTAYVRFKSGGDTQ